MIKRWASTLNTPATRGTILFLAGLLLTIREALTQGPERPSLYILFAGMMGLPFVWGKGPGGNNGNGSAGTSKES